jgi:hypothetical protein
MSTDHSARGRRRVACRVHETFLARLAIRVGAGVGGVGEHVVDGGVGGRHPADLRERTPSHGEAEALRAEPQPHATYRAELTEALEGGLDGTGDGFVWIEADLAVLLAPDESNRQAAAQLATRGLVANATLQARAQDVQFSFLCRLPDYADLGVGRRRRMMAPSPAASA